jgi:kinesin family protein 2/24
MYTRLQEKEVASVDELLALIDYGNTVRSTGQTGANADSSRSHAIIRYEYPVCTP